MAREDQERIFLPFQRGRTRHEEISGVGLGLYVSRRIVEKHNGTLVMRSEVGKKTVFTMTLPHA